MLNPQNNDSFVTEDKRDVRQVMFEKMMFGATPHYFRIEGDPRWHPVQWFNHPHLTEVLFSDKSVTQVEAAKLNEAAMAKVGPVPVETVETNLAETDTTEYNAAEIYEQYRAQTDDSDTVNPDSVLGLTAFLRGENP